jgi:hypothetical protein
MLSHVCGMVRLTHLTAQLEHGSQVSECVWGSAYSPHCATRARLAGFGMRSVRLLALHSIPSYCASAAASPLLQALVVQHVLLFLLDRWRAVGVIGCCWSSLGVSSVASQLAFCGALAFLELIVLAQFRLLDFSRLRVVERLVVAAFASNVDVKFVRRLIDDASLCIVPVSRLWSARRMGWHHRLYAGICIRVA